MDSCTLIVQCFSMVRIPAATVSHSKDMSLIHDFLLKFLLDWMMPIEINILIFSLAQYLYGYVFKLASCTIALRLNLRLSVRAGSSCTTRTF